MAGGVELATAYVSLVVEGSKVAPGVRSALGTADGEAARSGERAGRSFTSKFGSALKVGAALGAAFAVTKGVQFLGDAIAEAQEASVVTARTANVIKSMGNVAGVSAKQVANLAGSISNKVGMDDEAIQSGENLLLTFGKIQDSAGKGNDIFTQTTGLMVDMSAAMDQDMKSSAIQLGKALNDPVKGVTALSRVGVSFTEQQIEQIKTLTETNDVLGAQKIILGEVKNQFGGAGEAMATPAEKAKVAWDNLKEQIGTQLLPTFNRLMDWFSDTAIPAVSDFFDEFRKGKGVGGDVRDVVDDIRGSVSNFFDEFKNNEGFGGDVRDTMGDIADSVKSAAGYAKDLVGWFNDMPDWAKKAIIAGGIAAAVVPKVPGGTALSHGVSSVLGKTIGVQKVFETNPAALNGPGGGGPGGKVPVVGPVSAGALMASPLALAIFAGVTGYFANKVTPNGDKAPASTTPYAEGMPLPGDAINFGAADTAALKSSAAMHALLEGVYDTIAGFGNLKKAVGGYDDEIAQMLKKHPEQGMAKLRDISHLTGASIGELRDVLPKTSEEITKSGRFSKQASFDVRDWADEVLGLNHETDKVDGKKPKIDFGFPGLLGGITDTLGLGRNVDDVGKKKPKVPFEFPGLGDGVAKVWDLKHVMDQIHSKTVTITVLHNDTYGGLAGGGGHEPKQRALGGPVYAGKPYIVGERRPELFIPSSNGRIDPRPQMGGLSRRDIEAIAAAVHDGAFKGTRAGSSDKGALLLAARRT